MSQIVTAYVEPRPDEIEFLMQLGSALHASGSSANDLEHTMAALARKLALPNAQVLATPTALQVAVGALGHQHVYVLRVEPGSLNLGHLSGLDALAASVLLGKVGPREGLLKIDAITNATATYGPRMMIGAYALASGSFACILGGGVSEIVLATVIGTITGMIALVTTRHARVERVFEPLASFAASFIATAIAARILPLSSGLVTLAGLIVLIPGLALTTALQDLSMRHLATGTARLSSALMTFLGIVFGVALGSTLSTVWVGQAHIVAPGPLPEWTYLLAVVVSSLTFTVTLRVQPRDVGWVLLAGIIAVTTGRVGTAAVGPLGAFAGGLAVGLAGNLYARLSERPSAVMLVPGLLMLVPGSIGYQSFTAFLHADAVSGAELASQMFLVGAALVYGLLFANFIAPPPRLLGVLKRVYWRCLHWLRPARAEPVRTSTMASWKRRLRP